jgi:hypothetical protein
MKAKLLLRSRNEVRDGAFTEMVIWKVPRAVQGSTHLFKYRLAFIVDDVCVIRFDNEAGKGDHVHIGNLEQPYAFSGTEKLISDFSEAVLGWRG